MYLQVYCSVDGNGLICYKFLIERCTLTCSSGPSAALNLSRRHRHFALNETVDNATSFLHKQFLGQGSTSELEDIFELHRKLLPPMFSQGNWVVWVQLPSATYRIISYRNVSEPITEPLGHTWWQVRWWRLVTWSVGLFRSFDGVGGRGMQLREKWKHPYSYRSGRTTSAISIWLG
jgi:hypothetical protein